MKKGRKKTKQRATFPYNELSITWWHQIMVYFVVVGVAPFGFFFSISIMGYPFTFVTAHRVPKSLYACVECDCIVQSDCFFVFFSIYSSYKDNIDRMLLRIFRVFSFRLSVFLVFGIQIHSRHSLSFSLSSPFRCQFVSHRFHLMWLL